MPCLPTYNVAVRVCKQVLFLKIPSLFCTLIYIPGMFIMHTLKCIGNFCGGYSELDHICLFSLHITNSVYVPISYMLKIGDSYVKNFFTK